MAIDPIVDLFGGLTDSVIISIQTILFNAISLVPKVIAALVIFTVGWAVGSLFAWAVKRFLVAIKLEMYLKAHGLDGALGKVKFSHIIAQLLKYYIWLVFLQAAIALIDLGTISEFIKDLLGFAPAVIGAIAMIVFAAIFGEWVREKILETGKDAYLKTVAKVTKYFIIFLAIVVGLDTIGFETGIIKEIVITILQGISWGVALAFGIAFGLGSQDTARSIVQSFRKVLHI